MIAVLNSDATEMALRQTQARALLRDTQAHQALIDILTQANNNTTKIIICRAIATRNNHFLLLDDQAETSQAFIKPLFTALLSDDADLSRWAAQALAKFPEGVTAELTAMVLTPDRPLKDRLAGISALKLLPGKQPVITLSRLLAEPQELIRQRSAKALGEILAIQSPITAENFTQHYLPRLKKMDEQTFLQHQLELAQEQLLAAKGQIEQNKSQADRWRQSYENLLAEKFALLGDDDRVTLLKQYLVDSSDDSLRLWAISQIATWCRSTNLQSKPAAQQLVDLLTNFIADPNARIRQLTAEALEILSEKATTTAAGLLEQLTSETNPASMVAQLRALGSFEYPAVVNQGLKLLESPHETVATEAARTLGRITAAEPTALAAEQVQSIAKTFVRAYADHPEGLEIRRELLNGMGRIAAQDKYRQHVRDSFDPIITSALTDSAAQIRSAAVDALTSLHQVRALPILLAPGTHLLDDPDSGVRQEVIAAIKDYGQKDHLQPLADRSLIESDADVAKAIRIAFRKILTPLPTKDTYDSAVALKTTAGNKHLLRHEVLDILLEKINQDKAAGNSVPVEFELEAYTQKARLFDLQAQPSQAVHWFLKALALGQLPERQRDSYSLKVLDFALQNDADPGALSQAQPVIAALADRPAGTAALQSIAQACDKLIAAGNDNLLRAATVTTTLVVPIEKRLSAQQQKTWQNRRVNLALKIIDQQTALLASSQGNESPQAIRLLQLLDARLKGFPQADAPKATRIAALEKFRKTLQPPTPPKPAPKPKSPTPKPKTPDKKTPTPAKPTPPDTPTPKADKPNKTN